MAEHEEVVDAFTDTPQAEAMRPVDKPCDDEAGVAEDDPSTDDLLVQGGE